MTKSFFATSASRALSSVTSSETGLAFLTPSESFLALSRVLQALKGQIECFTDWRDCILPTETSMPASLRMSRVGRVTKPAPIMRTFLGKLFSIGLN